MTQTATLTLSTLHLLAIRARRSQKNQLQFDFMVDKEE